VECKGATWLISVSPLTPGVPILRRNAFEANSRSEIEAMAGAKGSVDRVLHSGEQS
jgi:hypothetical protein